VSRSVLELGLADNRIGGGGDDCTAAVEGRRADMALAAAATERQHSTAQHSTRRCRYGLRDGTKSWNFVDSRKGLGRWPARVECFLSSYQQRAVLGARQGVNGPAGVKPKDENGPREGWQ
jgi:hypothetical protein